MIKAFFPYFKTATLQTGALLWTLPDGSRHRFLFTSGLPGFQSLADIWTRGRGAIPPGGYYLSLTPYPSKKARGMFFPILPDPILNPADPARLRSEIGLHADLPPDGSNGCIVLHPPEQIAVFLAVAAHVHEHYHLDREPLTLEDADPDFH